jgi:tetratricopeptide (TPR) repeat protein
MRIKTVFESMNRLVYFCLLGVLLIGCGSSGSTTTPAATSATERSVSAASSVFVPAGVDSSTAERADSLASQSFVSLKKQRQAREQAQVGKSLVQISDSLWRYLEMGNDTTSIDSVSQDKRNAAIRAYNRGADSLRKYLKVTKASDLDSTRLRQLQGDLLGAAQEAFEEAIQLNPYDDATRNRLAQIYELRAERLGEEEAYRKAIDVYEKLVRLRKDQSTPFLRLANVLYETGQYDRAAENYRKARDTYLESVELSLQDEREVDSARVFQYVLAEADAHRFARSADPALERYELALEYAETAEQRNSAEYWIDWVNWDDGNIAASFARDSLSSLASKGNHAAAVQGFRTLKPKLRTQSARDEVDWRLARAEYQNGEQSQAADRLQSLFRRTEVNEDGVPTDSTYQKYFDTYGTICLNIGREKRDEDLRTALKYFQQSAEVRWERQALAELESGKLLRNNVEESVKYLERAAEEPDVLEVEDRLDLYRNLVRQHRRLGNREEAVRYRNLIQKIRKQAAAS